MRALATKLFWTDAIERSIKTVAQSIIALLTSNVTGLLDIDWKVTLSVSGLAGLVSILTSVASSGSGNSASLVVDSKKK